MTDGTPDNSNEVRIPLDDSLVRELKSLFDRIGPDGYVIKHLVAMASGKLRVEVRANEHPPPHFHVTYDGEDASYSIETGRRLPNVYGLERYDQMIFLWWKFNRRLIALKWNDCRPSNCPVGPVIVPDEN